MLSEDQCEEIGLVNAKGNIKLSNPQINNNQIGLMKVDFDDGIAKTKIAEKYGVTLRFLD